MTLEIKTVGTASRDHATMTAAEASVTNGNFPSAGTTIRFDHYNDSVFTESVDWNWSASNVDSVLISSPSGERHTGTRGTGARLDGDIDISVLATDIEWLEVFSNTNDYAVKISHGNTETMIEIRNMLIYDITENSTVAFSALMEQGGAVLIMNTQVFAVLQSGAGTREAFGIRNHSTARDMELYNVTVHDVVCNSASGKAICILMRDRAQSKVRNVMATDPGGSSSGVKECFDPSSPSSAVMSYNLSSDATASGTGSLINKTSANQFVSTTGGSEDLSLKSGADAIGAGVDLGTTPSGVEIDIKGRNRDAQGDIWDMGSHQFVSGATVDVGKLVNQSLTNSRLMGKLV